MNLKNGSDHHAHLWWLGAVLGVQLLCGGLLRGLPSATLVRQAQASRVGVFSESAEGCLVFGIPKLVVFLEHDGPSVDSSVLNKATNTMNQRGG